MKNQTPSIGFGTGITTLSQLKDVEKKQSNNNIDFGGFKDLKTEPLNKKKNCSDLEISLFNAEAKLFTLNQGLEKAYDELTRLNSERRKLKAEFQKEKSVINGDKAKARNTGAAIGAVIGGIIANVLGAAAGLGIGGNVGTLAEEGFDLATGQKTDYHFRRDIHQITQKINDVQKKIQYKIKPKIVAAKQLVEKRQSNLRKCQNGN